MKNLCILTSVHRPFDSRIYYKEAMSLLQAGYHVTIIAPYVKNETLNGIDIIGLSLFQNRLLRMLGTLRFLFASVRQKADFYHVHDPELLPIALIIKFILKKPVVYDVHEYYSESIAAKNWIPYILRKSIASLFDKIEKNISKHLSGIIAPNEDLKRIFMRYNARSIALWNYPRVEFFEHNEKQHGNNMIIYVGSIAKERGLETILQTMPLVRQSYPDVTCLMVGSLDLGGIQNKYLKNWEYYVHLGNLKFMGELPFPEVAPLIKSSSLGLVPLLPIPRYCKALPTKLIEYMASSKPVVASNFGLIDNIVNESECGILVNPENPQEFADAITYILSHPEHAREMGNNGRQMFLTNYNWNTEEIKLLKFYESLENNHIALSRISSYDIKVRN
jgi:glycosyltransferase involved in cell wall biosynthesis